MPGLPVLKYDSYNIIIPGDSAQIQREPSHHTIQHVVSWNIPEHQAPPSLSVQGSGRGGEILSRAL